MRNFPALLIVLCLVAVAAQFSRQPDKNSESFRRDALVCLPRLWKNSNPKVDLSASGDLSVRLAFPGRVREHQKRWTYPFLRFLARRHPGVTLRSLKIYEAGEDHEVLDLLACRALPRFYDDADERKSELIGRQLTAETGGQVLFLVDVGRSSTFGSVPNVFYQPRVQQRMQVCAVANGPIDESYWRRELRNAESFRIVQLPQTR